MPSSNNQIEHIQARGQLRVGTLYHPLYYFLRDGQQEGLDYELASQFAESLGVELSMVPAYSLNELFALLDSGQVDMLAAGLTNTAQRRQQYRFSPSYYHIAHTLVYRKGTRKPLDVSQIDGTISVLAGSSQAEWLYRLQQQATQSTAQTKQAQAKQVSAKHVPSKAEPPTLHWETRPDTDAEDLLRQVAENKTDYTLVSDILLARTQRYYPNIASAFTLGEPQPVAWMLDKRVDDSALGAMLVFLPSNMKVDL